MKADDHYEVGELLTKVNNLKSTYNTFKNSTSTTVQVCICSSNVVFEKQVVMDAFAAHISQIEKRLNVLGCEL